MHIIYAHFINHWGAESRFLGAGFALQQFSWPRSVSFWEMFEAFFFCGESMRSLHGEEQKLSLPIFLGGSYRGIFCILSAIFLVVQSTPGPTRGTNSWRVLVRTVYQVVARWKLSYFARCWELVSAKRATRWWSILDTSEINVRNFVTWRLVLLVTCSPGCDL